MEIRRKESGELLRVVGARTLKGANLDAALLSSAALAGADLRMAALAGAFLAEADLGGADLRGADLERAVLRWADLCGADLRGANLHQADLMGARYSSGTRWPRRFDPVRHGCVLVTSELAPSVAPAGRGDEVTASEEHG